MSRIFSSSSGSTETNIRDSVGNPITTTAGSLNVNITGETAGGTAISEYNEVTAVAMAATMTVLTYTVPPGQTLYLDRVLLSSDSVSTFTLNFDSVPNAKARISYTDFNKSLEYNAFELPAGTVVTLIATNNSSLGPASFNGTLQGVLQ